MNTGFGHTETPHKKKAPKRKVPVYCRVRHNLMGIRFWCGLFLWNEYKDMDTAQRAVNDLRKSYTKFWEFRLEKTT